VGARPHLGHHLGVGRQRGEYVELGEPESAGREERQDVADEGRTVCGGVSEAVEKHPRQVGQVVGEGRGRGVGGPVPGLLEGQPQPERPALRGERGEDDAFLRCSQRALGRREPAAQQRAALLDAQPAQGP
jgi:hypothetical protein